jgi:guanine nucleotide-binding protein subunit alpha
MDYRVTTEPSSLSKKSFVPGGNVEGFAFNPEIASVIYQLWQDPAIIKIMDHSSEFYLMDSAS